jgi:hypothetical protein
MPLCFATSITTASEELIAGVAITVGGSISRFQAGNEMEVTGEVVTSVVGDSFC